MKLYETTCKVTYSKLNGERHTITGTKEFLADRLTRAKAKHPNHVFDELWEEAARELQFVAVQSSRQVGDVVTVDVLDLKADPLCYCSLDTGFKGSTIARIEIVSEPFDNCRICDISENPNRVRLGPATFKSVQVRILEVSLVPA